MRIIRILVCAAWFGGALFLAAIAAPAVFSASPTRVVAGDVVGLMLTRWHYLAILVPLALLIGELRRPSAKLRAAILVVAVLAASAEAMVDLRVRHLRESSVVPISFLPIESPTRRAFGRLHGASMLLLALQIIASAGVMAGESKE